MHQPLQTHFFPASLPLPNPAGIQPTTARSVVYQMPPRIARDRPKLHSRPASGCASGVVARLQYVPTLFCLLKGSSLSPTSACRLGVGRARSRDMGEVPAFLCKICDRKALFPSSLAITASHDRKGPPPGHGGLADARRGKSQDRDVAIKVPKIYQCGSHE